MSSLHRVLFCIFVANFLLLTTWAVAGVDGQLETHECNSITFACTDTNGAPKCIPNSWICDGFSDCADNMDESNCFYTETNCTATGAIQCSATTCLSATSTSLCNGIIDCRGYNGTYVYAPAGVDESLDYCASGTTSTTTIYPSSMGWQPALLTNYPAISTSPWVLLNLTQPPFTQMTTTDMFWRSYCNRQLAINYCPRRCELRNLCTPTRVNPPRDELNKMVDELNPPVVGPFTRTIFPPTTTAAGTTLARPQPRLLNDDLLQRILLNEKLNEPAGNNLPGERSQQTNSLPDFDSNHNQHNYNNNNNPRRQNIRRDSAVDPIADPNTVYDWSDDEESASPSLHHQRSVLPAVALTTLVSFVLLKLSTSTSN